MTYPKQNYNVEVTVNLSVLATDPLQASYFVSKKVCKKLGVNQCQVKIGREVTQ